MRMTQYKQIYKNIRNNQLIILDGALGTELQRRGISTKLPLWSAQSIVDNPDDIISIHKDYIASGADIITTNTFRTNRITLAKANKQQYAKEWNTRAVELAKNAIQESENKNILTAGSVAPSEDCYEPSLCPDYKTAYLDHEEQIRYLVEAGVDFILLETFNQLSEAQAAMDAARHNNIPFWISWVAKDENSLLSDESLLRAIDISKKSEADAILLNCRSAELITQTLEKNIQSLPPVFGAYANGSGCPDDDLGWKFDSRDDLQKYLKFAKKWRQLGATIIGGCCGTTPQYINKLKQKLK